MQKECKLISIKSIGNVFNREYTIDIIEKILPYLISETDEIKVGELYYDSYVKKVLETPRLDGFNKNRDFKVIATPEQFGWIGGGKLIKGDKCLFYGQMSEVLEIQNPQDIYEHQSATIETELNDVSEEDKEFLKTKNGNNRMRHGFSCKQLFKVQKMTIEFLKDILNAGGDCSVKLTTIDDKSREPKGFCDILNQPEYHRINVVHFVEGKVVIIDKNSL